VPQGALTDSQNITMQVLDSGGAEVPGRVRVSKVYLILPDTLRFLTPATVKIAYDPTLVPASVPLGGPLSFAVTVKVLPCGSVSTALSKSGLPIR